MTRRRDDCLFFFWPHATDKIAQMAVDIELRRLAQTALIAAIEASYAMGFVEKTVRTLINPGKNLAAFGRKLALDYTKHWW